MRHLETIVCGLLMVGIAMYMVILIDAWLPTLAVAAVVYGVSQAFNSNQESK